MLVSLIKGNKISQLSLPDKIIGNYWVTDYENNEENQLINIEATNGKWCLISNEDSRRSEGTLRNTHRAAHHLRRLQPPRD